MKVSHTGAVGTGKQQQQQQRSYMLLCEVALGYVKELQNNYETVDTAPAGFDSVKALGREDPNKAQHVSMPNGAILPLGQLVDKTRTSKFGQWRMQPYNQFVVYDESQVVIRYIVQYHS